MKCKYYFTFSSCTAFCTKQNPRITSRDEMCCVCVCKYGLALFDYEHCSVYIFVNLYNKRSAPVNAALH